MEKLLTQQKPPLKNGYILFPHQKNTMKWMKHRETMSNEHSIGIRGGILCLCMGMGKTLIALDYALRNKGRFPTLIITSKTVMNEWKSEGVEKFYHQNDVKVLYLHSEHLKKAINKIDRKEILQYDIVITTYDVCMSACKKGKYYLQCLELGEAGTLLKDKIVAIHTRNSNVDIPSLQGPDVIYGTPWERVICDESQRFANPKTMTYKYMMAIYGKFKWCLTGTPIRNYHTDIWSQLRFCGYTGVTSAHSWKMEGVDIFKSHNLISAILKMSYDDAGIKMPEKIEREVSVELEGKHKEIYEHVLKQTLDTYSKMMKDLCSFSCVLALFLRLRQCVIAPYLITPHSKRSVTKNKPAMDVDITGFGDWCFDKIGEAGIKSAKMMKAIEIIRDITAENKQAKIVIFSMFTSCLDLLSDAIHTELPMFKFVQIDGDTKNRAAPLNQFKTETETRGLLMTYKVGSEGLNLTEAVHCICLEPWWTNAVHNQAKARLWRLGQTNTVYIHNLIGRNSIETNIIEMCQKKDNMSASYLNANATKRPEGAGLDKHMLGKILGLKTIF